MIHNYDYYDYKKDLYNPIYRGRNLPNINEIGELNAFSMHISEEDMTCVEEFCKNKKIGFYNGKFLDWTQNSSSCFININIIDRRAHFESIISGRMCYREICIQDFKKAFEL